MADLETIQNSFRDSSTLYYDRISCCGTELVSIAHGMISEYYLDGSANCRTCRAMISAAFLMPYSHALRPNSASRS